MGKNFHIEGIIKKRTTLTKKIEEKYLLYFWQVDSVRPLY
jgi:hypothetical protein